MNFNASRAFIRVSESASESSFFSYISAASCLIWASDFKMSSVVFPSSKNLRKASGLIPACFDLRIGLRKSSEVFSFCNFWRTFSGMTSTRPRTLRDWGVRISSFIFSSVWFLMESPGLTFLFFDFDFFFRGFGFGDFVRVSSATISGVLVGEIDFDWPDRDRQERDRLERDRPERDRPDWDWPERDPLDPERLRDRLK